MTAKRKVAADVKEILSFGVARRCCYAGRPDIRPDCVHLAVVSYDKIALCRECDLRRSLVGDGGTLVVRLADPVALLELVARRDTARKAQADLAEAVSSARRAGQPWSAVGALLGISRQAARQRFASLAAPSQLPLTTAGRR